MSWMVQTLDLHHFNLASLMSSHKSWSSKLPQIDILHWPLRFDPNHPSNAYSLLVLYNDAENITWRCTVMWQTARRRESQCSWRQELYNQTSSLACLWNVERAMCQLPTEGSGMAWTTGERAAWPAPSGAHSGKPRAIYFSQFPVCLPLVFPKNCGLLIMSQIGFGKALPF